jgi:hypothetical protein
MPVTKVGIVYYKDDPGKVFRIIYPTNDDSELDGPPTNGKGLPYLKDDGTHHSWTSLGTDPAREVVLELVPIGSPRAVLTGST